MIRKRPPLTAAAPEPVVLDFSGVTGKESLAVYTIENGSVVKLTKDTPALGERYRPTEYDYRNIHAVGFQSQSDAFWAASCFAGFIPVWTVPDKLLQSGFLCAAYEDAVNGSGIDGSCWRAAEISCRDGTVTCAMSQLDRGGTRLSGRYLRQLRIEHGAVTSVAEISPETIGLVLLCKTQPDAGDYPQSVWATSSAEEAGVVLDCMQAPVLVTQEGGRAAAPRGKRRARRAGLSRPT